MSFEASDKEINDIFNNVVFTIPRNQRKYVWNKDNWKELLDDVLSSYHSNRPHFIGSIVLKDNKTQNGVNYYTVIDGQQRITTTIILLTSIIRLFKEYDMKNEFEGTLKYVHSKDNVNNPHPLMSNKDDNVISDLITNSINWENIYNGTAFINTVIPLKKNKSYKEAFLFFYSNLKEFLDGQENKNEALLKIRNTILSINLIKIVANSDEDSYTIFEILNARGQELEDFELLKNYIMRFIVPIESRDEAKTKWESIENLLGTNLKTFIKHYAKHKFSNSKEKSAYRVIQKSTRGKNINELLDDLVLKASYYEKFVSPRDKGDNSNCTTNEARIFRFFKTKRAQQYRPILLSVMHQKDLGNIDENKYNEFLNYLYNFFVCFTIIGKSKSNRLEDVINKYSEILENHFSNTNMNEFAKKLKDRIPSQDWFNNTFKNVGYSNHVDVYKGEENKETTKLVLKLIEEYISQSTITDDFTIEHILPDSENSEENCQIGNLIPLEENLNNKCKDKSIKDKFPLYDKSKFSSARGIKSRYSNKEFNAESRTEYLSKLVYNNILELNQLDYSSD